MRFTLAYISTALLATVAMAAPAAQSNSENDVNIVARSSASPLEYNLKFQTFNWATKDGKTTVDRTFTLDLEEPAAFQVTDYKLGGDMYEISDNGKIIGMTSNTNSTASAFAETPEEAVSDKRFSRGEFTLSKGHHEITINVHKSPYGVGSGAVRVVKKLQALYGKDHDDDDDDDDDKDHDDDDDDDDDDDRDHDDDDDDWERDGDDDWHKKKGGKHGKKVVYVYHTIPCECKADPPAPAPAPVTVVEPPKPEYKPEYKPDPKPEYKEHDKKADHKLLPPHTSTYRKEKLFELVKDIMSDIKKAKQNVKEEVKKAYNDVKDAATKGKDKVKEKKKEEMRSLLSDKASKIGNKLGPGKSLDNKKWEGDKKWDEEHGEEHGYGDETMNDGERKDEKRDDRWVRMVKA